MTHEWEKKPNIEWTIPPILLFGSKDVYFEFKNPYYFVFCYVPYAGTDQQTLFEYMRAYPKKLIAVVWALDNIRDLTRAELEELNYHLIPLFLYTSKKIISYQAIFKNRSFFCLSSISIFEWR